MSTSSSAPQVIDYDASTIVEALVTAYQNATGKVLYAAQVERLLVDMIAYRESLVRLGIQDAFEQSLVKFARSDYLLNLGALVGITSRNGAEYATCTWRITLPEALTTDKVFSAGWEAASPSGAIWKTTADATISAGHLYVDVAAQAETAGTSENGIPAGSAFSPILSDCTVTNLAITDGGAAEETDAQLRTRILEAPFGLSVGGPARSYRSHALNADASVIDVAVLTLGNGQVGVYPLTESGLPSSTVKATVLSALSADTVRPLNDAVIVSDPTEIAYTLEANITPYASADASTVLSLAQSAAESYVTDRAAGLGRDLVGSQAIKALSVDGVYKVALLNWTDQVLAANAWAHGVVTLHLLDAVND